jgi:hypothetical protein
MLKTSHALQHKMMGNEIPHWVCAVSNCDIAINFELSINFELPLQKKVAVWFSLESHSKNQFSNL